MSPLIRSIVDITEVFNQYASQSCDGASLSKRELKNLLERELGDVLQVRPLIHRRNLQVFGFHCTSQERPEQLILILFGNMTGLHSLLSLRYLNVYCNLGTKEVNSIYLVVLKTLLIETKYELIGHYH